MNANTPILEPNEKMERPFPPTPLNYRREVTIEIDKDDEEGKVEHLNEGSNVTKEVHFVLRTAEHVIEPELPQVHEIGRESIFDNDV